MTNNNNNSGFQKEREALGSRLRDLRRRTGMTGVDFAGRLGWAQSKVSRLELGRQTATAADLEAWVDATGAPVDLAEELHAMLRTISAEYVTWRREFRVGVRPKQRAFLGLEARVNSIRGFETCVVPGLLQTPEYARYRIAEMPVLHQVPEDVEQALAIRMQRQQVIYDRTKTFHFVLSEAVLRSRLCPPEVHAGQLDRLVTLSGLDNVRVGVIPFAARLPYAPLNGFWVFDYNLVTFETFAAEVHLRDPDEIRLYDDVFEKLVSVAVYDVELRRLVGQVVNELRT